MSNIATTTDRELLSLSRLSGMTRIPVRRVMQLIANVGIEAALVLNGTAYYSVSAVREIEQAAGSDHDGNTEHEVLSGRAHG